MYQPVLPDAIRRSHGTILAIAKMKLLRSKNEASMLKLQIKKSKKTQDKLEKEIFMLRVRMEEALSTSGSSLKKRRTSNHLCESKVQSCIEDADECFKKLEWSRAELKGLLLIIKLLEEKVKVARRAYWWNQFGFSER